MNTTTPPRYNPPQPMGMPLSAMPGNGKALHREQLRAQRWYRRSGQNFANFYLDFIHTHHAEHGKLDHEFENIARAFRWASAHDAPQGFAAAVNLIYTYLESRGHYVEANQWLRQAETRAQAEGAKQTLATLLLHQGRLFERMAQLELAHLTWWRGITLARQLRDLSLVCHFLLVLAKRKSTQNEHAQAERLLELARRIGARHKQPALDCEIYRAIGHTASLQGHLGRAEVAFNKALALARTTDNREQMTPLLLNLGVIASSHGQFDQAIDYYQQALQLAEEHGNIEMISVILVNLGQRALDKKLHDEARTYLRRALGYARRLGFQARVFTIMLNLAMLANDQGTYAESDDYLQQCLEIAPELERPSHMARLLFEWGSIEVARNCYAEAEAQYRACLAFCETRPTLVNWLAQARDGLAQLYYCMGNLDAIPPLLAECRALAAQHPQNDFLQNLVEFTENWVRSLPVEIPAAQDTAPGLS